MEPSQRHRASLLSTPLQWNYLDVALRNGHLTDTAPMDLAEHVKTEEAEPADPVDDVGEDAQAEQAEPVPFAATSMRVRNMREKVAQKVKEENVKKEVKKEERQEPQPGETINVDEQEPPQAEAEAQEAPSLAFLHAATLSLALDRLPPSVGERHRIIQRQFRQQALIFHPDKPGRNRELYGERIPPLVGICMGQH